MPAANPPGVRAKRRINVVNMHRGTIEAHIYTSLSSTGHYGHMQMANAALKTLSMPVDSVACAAY